MNQNLLDKASLKFFVVDTQELCMDGTVKVLHSKYPEAEIITATNAIDFLKRNYKPDGVLSVGASNLNGDRAPYSNYGKGLDVVAPGGDLSTSAGILGGIPTTGGTWMDIFWKGLAFPKSRWSKTVYFKGKYWWMEGTSFSSPAVAGVVGVNIAKLSPGAR